MVAIPPQKILVPIDFSGHNDSALRYAAGMVDTGKAELFLIHILENYPGFELFYDQETRDQFMKDMEKKALERLSAVRDQHKSNWRKGVSEVVRLGTASDEVCKFATEEGIDLIVLCAHGLSSGFVEKAFRGSVHERIIQNAPCPVLTVNENLK